MHHASLAGIEGRARCRGVINGENTSLQPGQVLTDGQGFIFLIY